MTEVQDNTVQRTERMRRIALVLTGFWVICWTVSLSALALGSGFMHLATFPHTPPALDWWLTVALLVYPPWIGAAISWRWEATGGVVQVLTGFLLFTVAAGMYLHPLESFALLFAPLLILAPPSLVSLALLLFAGLPLAAGFLLLASWWKSTRLARP